MENKNQLASSHPLYKEDRFLYMLKDDENKVIFDWTARAACSYVCCIYFSALGLMDKVIKGELVHNLRHQIWKEKGYLTLEELSLPSYKKIKFVRNPFARAVSSFRLAPENETFRTFIKKLSDPKTAATYDEVILFHSCLQSLSTDHLMNKIIKMENIENEIHTLNEFVKPVRKYTLPLDVPLLTEHHSKRSSLGRLVCDLTQKEINNMSVKPAFHEYYDTEIKHLVAKIYEKDINAFKYTFEDILPK